ncbi:MAG: flippase [Clostridiales bacterium]|nr:flippase [Clostridiales bacterium]
MEKKPSLKSNLIFNIEYQVLAIILPLITTPYVSRVLGAHNIGVYSYTQAFANYFYLFAMLGVNNYGNRKIAQVRDDKEKLNKTFWEIFMFQSFVAIIIAVIYILYCIYFDMENRLIYFMQFFYVLSGAFDVNWFCFGMEKFKLTTIRSTIVRIGMTILVFAFVHDRSDLWIYTFILSFGMLASAFAVWPYIWKTVRFVKPNFKGVAQHIKPNLFLFWPVIAVSLYNIMDKLMLGYFSTEEEVAFYTYAERIVQIPLTLILALDNVIMPKMSNLYAVHEEDRAMKLMDQVMMFAMCVCAAMAFGLAGIGKVFAPWFYGSDYERCGLFILWLSPILIFKGWASAIRTQFLIPAERDNIYIISLSIGAVVNLIFNIILIPKLNGIGAIIGTIAAEFSVCFVQFFMSRHSINLKQYITNGVSFIVAGFIMYIPVKLLECVSTNTVVTLFVQIAVGIILYSILSVIYIVKIHKDPTLVNVVLKIFRFKFCFK